MPHVFATSYAAVDRELPALIAKHQPDALLMFGLAPRDALHPHRDARAQCACACCPTPAGNSRAAAPLPRASRAALAMPAPARALLAAARAPRVPAALSRDAGRYLCNYLCWRAARPPAKGGPRLAAFVHVPLVRRKPGHAARRNAPFQAGRSDARRRGSWSRWPRQHGVNLPASTDAPSWTSDRRRLLLIAAAAGAGARCAALAAPLSHRPRRRAIRRAAGRARRPDRRPATRHRPGRAHAHAAGAGAGRLPRRRSEAAGRRAACRRARRDLPRALPRGPSLVSAEHADAVSLTGLTLDGGGQPLPRRRGLVHLARREHAAHRRLRGRLAPAAMASRSSNATAPSRHHDRRRRRQRAVLHRQPRPGHSPTSSAAPAMAASASGKATSATTAASSPTTASRTRGARAGGTGQNGNAINVFRAGDVIVRGNISATRLFRGARQCRLQHPDRRQQLRRAGRSRDLFRVRVRDAVIADNVVDGAEIGISVTNFNEGGRLAHLRGNIVRNLARAARTGRRTKPASASASRPTPPSPATSSSRRALPASAPAGANICATSPSPAMWCATPASASRSRSRPAPAMPPSPATLSPARKRGAIVGMEWAKAVTGDLAKTAPRAIRNC